LRCYPASHAAYPFTQFLEKRLQRQGQRVVGGLAGTAVWGCVTVAPPSVDPGCWVGRSVPDALGTLFVGCVVDSLEAPAGGLCVVVKVFWAKTGVAPSIVQATKSFFIGAT
jgi:hypothetical protein